MHLKSNTVQAFKIPISVLVVVYTTNRDVLLLERSDHPGYWQSITGSQNPDESLWQTAVREIKEETGLIADQFELIDWRLQNQYEIFLEWRWRYAPGVTHNTEHVFGLELPKIMPISIASREHLSFIWLPWHEAAKKVFSWSNAEAIRMLETNCSYNE